MSDREQAAPIVIPLRREHLATLAEALLFRRRSVVLGVLAVLTLLLAWQAWRGPSLHGAHWQLPKDHAYLQVLRAYQDEFGGANPVLVALVQKDAAQDIYNARFLGRLRKLTEEIATLHGVDRARVASLFTPGLRHVDVTDGVFTGGPVVPPDFKPTAPALEQLRRNVRRGGLVGRFTTADERGALVYAELLETDPATGKPPDEREFARALEQRIRERYANERFDVHIVGHAVMAAEVAAQSGSVLRFFGLALVLAYALTALYLGSLRLALLPCTVMLVALVWHRGLAGLFGVGADPMTVAVPAVVLALVLSHALQHTAAWVAELAAGRNGYDAALQGFRRLSLGGTAALLAILLACLTLALAPVPLVRSTGWSAAFGALAVAVAAHMLLPLWLSHMSVRDAEAFVRRQQARSRLLEPGVRMLSRAAAPGPALAIILLAAVVLGWSKWQSGALGIGPAGIGAPELAADSSYNRDAAVIGERFTASANLLKVIAETDPEACVDHDVMEQVDRFGWDLQNNPGVLEVIALPAVARQVGAAFADDNPKFHVLPRNRYNMVQAITPVPSASGLLNPNCSAMPVLVYTRDRQDATLRSIAAQVRTFNDANARAWLDLNRGSDSKYCGRKLAARRSWGEARLALKRHIATLRARGRSEAEISTNAVTVELRQWQDETRTALEGQTRPCPVNFAFASGPLSAVAAADETLRRNQWPLLAWFFLVLLLGLRVYCRSWSAAACVVLPLYLVASLVPALMVGAGIALTMPLLPLAVLAAGLGLDYQLCLFTAFQAGLDRAQPPEPAWSQALSDHGKTVAFSALCVALALAAWRGAGLQLQADVGLLIGAAALAHAGAALLLLPALCRYFLDQSED